MTPEMRAKRDSLFEEVFQKRCEDGVPYTATAKEMQRDDWNEAFDAAHALMSEERERLKKLCWKKEQSVRNAQTEMYQSARDDMDEIISAWNECAEKLANALDICKDEIMGCGAHRTDDSQKLADEALAHFEKLKEGS